MTITAFYIDSSFILKNSLLDDFSSDMIRISEWLDAVITQKPLLQKNLWLLSGETLDEATRYSVFDDDQPSNEALAVLRAEIKREGGDPPLRHISIWNGYEDEGGADIRYTISRNPMFNSRFELTVRVHDGTSPLGDWQTTTNALSAIVAIWNPHYIACGPFYYPAVFDDRPGVGWMLYLPRKLTAKQVPEARALVPVMQDKEQLGTIIVSVTDGVFSMNNPDHVRIANEIEIRLVDQDLLPTFRQIQEAR